MHSFRQPLRDRLRAVQRLSDMSDQTGDWVLVVGWLRCSALEVI